VLVGSIQTIARRGMPEVDLIIIDEAHTVAGS
jgi:superfamily II DNA or RNA helicase